MDTLGMAVTIAVAFIGGSGFTKLIEIVTDKITKAAGKRRAEVDRMARQLTDAVTAEAVASRRERRALELLSATRRIALDHGVPYGDLPEVDLGD